MFKHGISNHFRREARIMAGMLLVLLLLGLIASFVGPYLIRYIEVDRCLDSGGKYDYEKNCCLH